MQQIWGLQVKNFSEKEFPGCVNALETTANVARDIAKYIIFHVFTAFDGHILPGDLQVRKNATHKHEKWAAHHVVPTNAKFWKIAEPFG